MNARVEETYSIQSHRIPLSLSLCKIEKTGEEEEHETVMADLCLLSPSSSCAPIYLRSALPSQGRRAPIAFLSQKRRFAFLPRERPQATHRFLEQKNQLTISARNPVQEITIDGLTLRSIKYNFTPITALTEVTDPDPNLDVLFAILEVGTRKPANSSYVADIRIVDQSEYEAPAMATLPGTFPIVIGLRLKTSTYHGISLATKVTSAFVFNTQIPEAIALQSWCLANANKLKELPPLSAMQPLILKPGTSPSTATVKIVNLPTSVQKIQLINVEGIARVTDFNQRFYYLACSICNRASAAYENEDLWCNYCSKSVPSLTRSKFDIQITDQTGTIQATVFPEIAEQFYGITTATMQSIQPGEPLPVELLHSLAQTKTCNITLKAYTYTYAGISQCRFNVHSISNQDIPEDNQDTPEDISNLHQPLALPPNTPAKKDRPDTASASASDNQTQANPSKKTKLDSPAQT